MKKEINPAELDFLLRFPAAPNTTSPVDFITHTGWGAIKTLSAMDEFRNLDRDIENNSKRWRKFVEAEAPEKEKFPQVRSWIWSGYFLLSRYELQFCVGGARWRTPFTHSIKYIL